MLLTRIIFLEVDKERWEVLSLVEKWRTKFFSALLRAWKKRKNESPQEIKPKTFRFHTLMLYHLPTETL